MPPGAFQKLISSPEESLGHCGFHGGVHGPALASGGPESESPTDERGDPQISEIRRTRKTLCLRGGSSLSSGAYRAAPRVLVARAGLLGPTLRQVIPGLEKV